MRAEGLTPWVRKIPWRGKWKPTPVLLPGASHGQRSLVVCSPWGCEELNMTEVTKHTHTHTHTHTHREIKGQHLTGVGLDMMEIKKEAMNDA